MANPEGVEQAVRALKRAQIVALPTETVYGLAARADDAEAVARVFAAKGRPSFNPLIVHVADQRHAATLAQWTNTAQCLADAFWPGPLTLVLPRANDAPIADLALAGLDTIALRAPAHAVTRAVIAHTGPLVMPSANPSGRLSPTSAMDVSRAFTFTEAGAGDAQIALILDDGPTRHGLESTVVGLTGARPTLLRAGPITADALAPITGPLSQPDDTPCAPHSPGRTLAHYAPARARLRLDATTPTPGEAYLAFGPSLFSDLNLSPTGDLIEAAANLFRHLRALDEAGFSHIAIAPIPRRGIGVAITDRLERAANVQR